MAALVDCGESGSFRSRLFVFYNVFDCPELTFHLLSACRYLVARSSKPSDKISLGTDINKFVNPDSNYHAAPQQIVGGGLVQGHSQVVTQMLTYVPYLIPHIRL
jgi:hypothetical protein